MNLWIIILGLALVLLIPYLLISKHRRYRDINGREFEKYFEEVFQHGDDGYTLFVENDKKLVFALIKNIEENSQEIYTISVPVTSKNEAFSQNLKVGLDKLKISYEEHENEGLSRKLIQKYIDIPKITAIETVSRYGEIIVDKGGFGPDAQFTLHLRGRRKPTERNRPTEP